MTINTVRQAVAAAALACLVPAASADVLTFDDLAGNLNFFTADYHGFRFGTNSVQTTAWFYTKDVNSFYGPKSGTTYVATDFQLYNGGLWEATQPISNTTPFKFDGAWFTGGEQVRYELYVANARVFTSADSPELSNVPTYVPSNFNGLVTSVVIVGHQGFYAMDDFTFNAPVPEPATYALFLAGLAGISTLVRCSRKH